MAEDRQSRQTASVLNPVSLYSSLQPFMCCSHEPSSVSRKSQAAGSLTFILSSLFIVLPSEMIITCIFFLVFYFTRQK